MKGTLAVTPQMEEDASYLDKIGKQLPNDFAYKWTALRNINTNGYMVSSARRLLRLGIKIPERFVKDNKVQIMDVILTEIDKESYRKLRINKACEKLKKTIEQSYILLPGDPLDFAIDKDIYDDVMEVMISLSKNDDLRRVNIIVKP